MNHVIIGGGIAGLTAARRLRTLAPNAHVTLVEAEPRPYYLRPGLIAVLSGENTLADISPYPLSWYEEQGIHYRAGSPAVELEPAAQRVVLANGERLPYDRLLLATGAEAFRPPIPGADLPGVFTLRSAVDAERIRTRAEGATAALVIGGGWLGLEAARALRAHDLAVTVLERAPWLLPRQLDRQGGDVLAAQLADQGIDVRVGTECGALTGSSEVEKALLGEGGELAVELVVISAGIRPRVALAAQAGLQVTRGVVVDDHLASSAPGVFACGDVAEWRGEVYGIVPAAREQGEVAAANMVELGSARYQGTTVQNRLKVAGVDLLCLGDTQPRGGPGEEYRLLDPERGVYRKLVVREGRLVGAILLGDLTGEGAIRELIASGEQVPDLRPLLEGTPP